jgi:hypothetical protein
MNLWIAIVFIAGHVIARSIAVPSMAGERGAGSLTSLGAAPLSFMASEIAALPVAARKDNATIAYFESKTKGFTTNVTNNHG